MGSRMNNTTASGCVSPVPEGAAYRHNPYAHDCSQEVTEPAAIAAAAPEQARFPVAMPSVLHTGLSGYVTFVPYPTQSYPIPECELPREQLVRVFVGQLPYRVTPMQLSWLCDTIAPGAQLFHMETIMKKTGMKGKRLPTGCIHALARPQDVDYLIDCMSYRVLFDDSGIWCAQTPEEQEQLQNYCAAMKQNEQLRFRDRPYQPVVVQFATSHYGTSYTPRRTSPPPSHASTPYTATPSVSPSAAAFAQPSWDQPHEQSLSPPQVGYGASWNSYGYGYGY